MSKAVLFFKKQIVVNFSGWQVHASTINEFHQRITEIHVMTQKVMGTSLIPVSLP